MNTVDNVKGVILFLSRALNVDMKVVTDQGKALTGQLVSASYSSDALPVELTRHAGYKSYMAGPTTYSVSLELNVKAGELTAYGLLGERRLGVMLDDGRWVMFSCVVKNVSVNSSFISSMNTGQVTIDFSFTDGVCDGSPYRLLVYDHLELKCDELVNELYCLCSEEGVTRCHTDDRPGYSGLTLVLPSTHLWWSEALCVWRESWLRRA